MRREQRVKTLENQSEKFILSESSILPSLGCVFDPRGNKRYLTLCCLESLTCCATDIPSLMLSHHSSHHQLPKQVCSLEVQVETKVDIRDSSVHRTFATAASQAHFLVRTRLKEQH